MTVNVAYFFVKLLGNITENCPSTEFCWMDQKLLRQRQEKVLHIQWGY